MTTTVWGTLVSGDSPSGLGTDTVTNAGFSATVRTNTSKSVTAWQFEVHVLSIDDNFCEIGCRDQAGRLSYYQATGRLYRVGSNFEIATGPALQAGDILTLVFDNNSVNVDYYHTRAGSTVLVGSASNGGFPDPVFGHLVVFGASSMQGVWTGLSHPQGGVATWDEAASVAQEYLRALHLNLEDSYTRQIWLPLPDVSLREITMAFSQEVLLGLDWRDADVFHRQIWMPLPQTALRQVSLSFSEPQEIPQALALDLHASNTEFQELLRQIWMPFPQTDLRTLDLTAAATQEITRPLVLEFSEFQEVTRGLDLSASTAERTEVLRGLVLATQSRAGQSVTGALRLLLRGRPVEILTGEIWADEGSPYWQSTVTLARTEDYALFPRGTAYDLEIYGTAYRQMVDNRSLSRGFSGDQPGDNAQISGLSPVALQGSGWAQGITRTWDAPVLASIVATEMLGAVTWDAVDWLIPAYRLAVQGQTPLEVVTTLAAAVGATLESAPDGSLTVRPLFLVRAPDLARTTPAATLTDDDIYTVTESPEAVQVVNRVRVTDGTAEASGYQDRLEFKADDADPQAGVIRAYPLPWRPGVTVRSTRSRVRLYLQGEATREIDEVLEVRDGVASSWYPPLTLLEAEYLDTDLGAVTVAGSEIRTGVQGWTLLRVRYTVRAIEYRAVALDPDLQALVVMEGEG